MAEVAVVQLDRAKLKKLFLALGWSSATKWPDDKLVTKLADISDVAKGPKHEDAEDAKMETDILAAIESGSSFEIIGDALATEPVDPAAVKAPKEKKEKAPKEPKSAKEPKVAKEPKPAAPAKPKGPEGIRPVKSRIFLGAGIWNKYGLAHGITDELVAELDAQCKDSNPTESRAWLKIAWHAVNGYLQEFPVDAVVPVSTTPAAEVAKTEEVKAETANAV